MENAINRITKATPTTCNQPFICNSLPLMIDATHRLAYPLGQKLEGSANGNISTEGDDGHGI